MINDILQGGGSRHVLAIASGGGHWAQLMLLREALDGHQVTYATTMVGLAEVHGLHAEIVPDCNRNRHGDMLRAVWTMWRLIRRVRPDAVVSTGALPGLIALAVARATGRRTIWIESIANAKELSMSGRMAVRIAHQCFVQWPDLARQVGATHAGAVL